jgi:hypothetical protein
VCSSDLAASQIYRDAAYEKGVAADRQGYATPTAGLGDGALSNALGKSTGVAKAVLDALKKVSLYAVKWINDPELGKL